MLHRTVTAGLGLAIGLGLGLQGAPASAKDWSTVRIATEGAYPPWNSTDSAGDLIGFELDLAEDLCARMEVACEIVAQDWEGIIPALQAGKYDVIMAGMSITDERRKVIQFSESYAKTPARFAVREGSDLAGYQSAISRIDLAALEPAEEAAIEDLRSALKGTTVGVQVATTHANFLEDYLGDAVEIRRYDTQENLDFDLQAGRIEAALASMSYWQPLLEGDNEVDFALIGPGMTGGPFGEGVGVGVRQGDDELVEMFNQAIAEAKADGTIAELAKEWFGFDASS